MENKITFGGPQYVVKITEKGCIVFSDRLQPDEAAKQAWSSVLRFAAEHNDAIASYLAQNDALSTVREEGFRAGRLAGLTEAAKFVRAHSILHGVTPEFRPRIDGDRMGIGYAAGIEALMEKQP